MSLPDDKSDRLITHYLGLAMVLAVAGIIVLVYTAVTAETAIEPAAVALIGQVGQIAAILISGLVGFKIGTHVQKKREEVDDSMGV